MSPCGSAPLEVAGRDRENMTAEVPQMDTKPSHDARHSGGEPGRERYPRVFEPIVLGPVPVRNRIYMPPHGVPLEVPVPGFGPNAMPAAELAYYYAERAAGGVGLIFQSTLVAPFASWPGPPASSP